MQKMNHATTQILLEIENVENLYLGFYQTLASIPDDTPGNEDAARIIKKFTELQVEDESINLALVDWPAIIRYGRDTSDEVSEIQASSLHYKVVFLPPSTGKDQLFASKQEAANYKSEHPDGKFASVIKKSSTMEEV